MIFYYMYKYIKIQQTNLDLVPALFITFFRTTKHPFIPTRIYDRCIKFYEKHKNDEDIDEKMILIVLSYIKSLSDIVLVYYII